MPALDFLRSDILAETGNWRETDVMDGTEAVEPVATLERLLRRAHQAQSDVYLFGRTYQTGGSGIHDVHRNQGSSGSFLNTPENADKDHNAIWQDGAVMMDLGDDGWAAYFTAFTQQYVPTDNNGNPVRRSHPIRDTDF